ncbi:hypothetical protein BKA59DRAFT_452522 [Fusarium tricinctum]|uniref:Uncharacterized protein n=1 Tax=Fusarium tricinctum TaxID=61284 RepID=A0A8K0S052_9HYPO|nr:hypothetical protein BKA59DRAFT_452522 [Fusarium tricinctum]
MARHGIVVFLAAAAFAASTITTGVTGTTDVLGTTVTESTQATDSTEVLDTTVTETATGSTEATISIEPTITTEFATTLATTTAEATTTVITTTEATTTSVEAPPVCESTQILVNPSFDDNSDASPWTLGAGVTVSQVNPRSKPNFLYNTMSSGRTSTTFSQTLPPLGSLWYQLDYYFNMQTALNGQGFSCSAVPSINGQELSRSEALTDNGPYGFQLSTQRFTGDGSTENSILSITVSCTGSYNTIIIAVDDVSFKRVCET